MNEGTKPKRKWIPIVLGIVIALFVIAVGGIALMVVLFRQSMTETQVDAPAAAAEFAAIRARFPDQQPLIRMVDGRPQYLPDRAPLSSPRPITTMHVVAWDDDEGRLVTFALPFWLLRLQSNPIQLGAYTRGWDDHGVSFRIEDLEQYGPGLLLDVDEPNEGRVIIWME